MFALQTAAIVNTSTAKRFARTTKTSSSAPVFTKGPVRAQRGNEEQGVRLQKQKGRTGSIKDEALVVSTAMATFAMTQTPAYAYDLISSENAGALKVWALGLFIGVTGVSVVFLPFICGTLNPIQMLKNLGLVEGEVTNFRKFKRNGEPMEHGTKFGHKWYDTSAFNNGKKIDFAFTQKTIEAQEKQ